MFHVSFLIKEGRAKMIVRDDRDDGLPYIRPMKEGKSGAGNNTLIRFHEKEKYFTCRVLYFNFTNFVSN